MLVLTVPLGPEEANKNVRVTVESVPEPMSQEEWVRFVQSIAGSITDPTFRRHPQGEYEKRDEWLRFLEETHGKWQGEFVREPEGDYEERKPL